MTPEVRQRTARERRPLAQTGEIEDRRGQVAETHRLAHDSRGPLSRGQHDHQRHVDLRPVKALAMVEEIMFPHPFTMIGSHDDQGAIEHAAATVIHRTDRPVARPGKPRSCRRSLHPGVDTPGAMSACRPLPSTA